MSAEHAGGEEWQTATRNRRPQQLLLSFLGALVVDRDCPPISSRVFLHLLRDVGVTEAAGRATLARMVRKGLLARVREGRTARFSPTPAAAAMIRKASQRVRSPEPFTHPEGEWTLLSYSIPESRRDLRHQIRALLTWAGFGGLRDGLWIAPGRVDVAELFAGERFAGVADAFFASPQDGTDVHALLHKAWDVDAIRAEHETFLATWNADRDSGQRGRWGTRLTLLGADWLQLLRTDPGLPAAYLPGDWPAPDSAALYQERFDAFLPGAVAWLGDLLRSDTARR